MNKAAATHRKRPSRPRVAPAPVEPEQAATFAGLRYVTDTEPGIRRETTAQGVRYLTPTGKVLKSVKDLARIKSLVIPPAWVDVWIATNPEGHLQATGRDARGRKQYRYHPRWRVVRDETKFGRMTAFGAVLPKIRKHVEADLSRPGLPREKVLATVVRLLDLTFIRVGNEEYARTNKSVGLTTMRDRHVTLGGSSIRFNFRGKSGVRHDIDLNDRRLAKIIKACRDLPGQELFQYLDDQNQPHSIDSADVNDYLRAITDGDYTAKDFRTWAGTVLAFLALREFDAFATQKQAKANVVSAIARVAGHLGNTPAVCKKCYVHPQVLIAYMEGSLPDLVIAIGDHKTRVRALRTEEAAVLDWLAAIG